MFKKFSKSKPGTKLRKPVVTAPSIGCAGKSSRRLGHSLRRRLPKSPHHLLAGGDDVETRCPDVDTQGICMTGIQDISAISAVDHAVPRVHHSVAGKSIGPLCSTMQPILHSTMLPASRVPSAKLERTTQSRIHPSPCPQPLPINRFTPLRNVAMPERTDPSGMESYFDVTSYHLSSAYYDYPTVPNNTVDHYLHHDQVVLETPTPMTVFQPIGHRLPCEGHEAPPVYHQSAVDDVTAANLTCPHGNSLLTLPQNFSVDSDATAFMQTPLCRATVTGYMSPTSRRKIAKRLKRIRRHIRCPSMHQSHNDELRTLAIV